MSHDVDISQLERDAKHEWCNNSSVRDEFLTYEIYFAYKKADALGHGKIQAPSKGLLKGSAHSERKVHV